MTLKPDSKTGKVRVWDIPGETWRDVFPVDAREMIAAGTARLHRTEAEADKAAQAESDPPASDDDLLKFSRAQLNDFAKSVGIDGEAFANKAQVVEALRAADFRIPDNVDDN